MALLPLPPLVEETAPLMFVKVPPPVPVILTTTVQLEATAIEPSFSEIEAPPAVAVAVPPQESDSPFGVATTSPAGSASANATPDSATVLADGLVSVKVSVLVPAGAIDAGLNAAAIDGGATTVRVAKVALPKIPPAEETRVLWLVRKPAAVPVTSTATAQLESAAIEPPENDIPAPPVVKVTVPPQELVTLEAGDAVAKVTWKFTPVRATVLAAGLVSVKVSVLVPFSGIDAGLNTAEIEGPSTVAYAGPTETSAAAIVAAATTATRIGTPTPRIIATPLPTGCFRLVQADRGLGVRHSPAATPIARQMAVTRSNWTVILTPWPSWCQEACRPP